MFNRAEEMYQRHKRPDGHDFMREAKSVGVPISLSSSTYRYAFSESKMGSGAPAKKQKTLSGQPVESFEFKLARSVRRLSKYLVSGNYVNPSHVFSLFLFSFGHVLLYSCM